MKKIKNYIGVWLLCWLVIQSQGNFIQTVSSSNQISGKLKASLEDTWEDSQWQFYKTNAPFNQSIEINLTYSGDLDIDLWVFVDSNTTGTDQRVNAWDITHCNIDRQPTLYSAIKSTEVNFTAPERIFYSNIEFEIERIIYILVFVESGIGESNYELSATNEIEILNKEDGEKCWTIVQAWIIFGISIMIIFGFVLYVAKKKARTPDQKAADRLKKEQKTKTKVKDKQKSTMAARKSGRR